MAFPFRKKTKKKTSLNSNLITAKRIDFLSEDLNYSYDLEEDLNINFYKKIRNSIPLIHACLEKIKKLIGTFQFQCENKTAEHFLNEFNTTIKVGTNMVGMDAFIRTFLDDLLMYGYSVGEIILNDNLEIEALYNANLEDVIILTNKHNPLKIDFCKKHFLKKPSPPIDNRKILFSSLNPKPGKIKGESVLKSLPFVSNILLIIFDAIKKNFIRIGNVRFAITYRPPNDSEIDKARAMERTEAIAKEWAKGINSNKGNDVYDFITCGDVKIEAIGADNKLLDCQIPIRQIEEQILAVFGIMPFMVGLSWSTTERMSEQQAKLYTKEVEYYRNILSPTILKIANFALKMGGFLEKPKLKWSPFSLNNKIEEEKARLYKAQAEETELKNEILKLKLEKQKEGV